jgi:hypothetical protein
LAWASGERGAGILLRNLLIRKAFYHWRHGDLLWDEIRVRARVIREV